MELESPNHGGSWGSESPCNGEAFDPLPPGCAPDGVDTACSTPYVSAPFSPGGYFFSAPASPVHFIILSSSPYSTSARGAAGSASGVSVSCSLDFEFSAPRCSGAAASGSMTSADELFLNGQIRPVGPSSHLQRPRALAPLPDLEGEEEDGDEEAAIRGRDVRLRSRSLSRRARSMSPPRKAPPPPWEDEEEEKAAAAEVNPDLRRAEIAATPTRTSASSSRSSSTSSSRVPKRWVFLKGLLYRSKSEGGGVKAKDGFWRAIAFSPSKDRRPSLFSRDKSKDPTKPPPATAAPTNRQKQGQKIAQRSAANSPAIADGMTPSASCEAENGVGTRRVPALSPHERHYTANRAQAEEMRKKTLLPYRQGLLGCLGFSSGSYGAINGFARNVNPVSSR